MKYLKSYENRFDDNYEIRSDGMFIQKPKIEPIIDITGSMKTNNSKWAFLCIISKDTDKFRVGKLYLFSPNPTTESLGVIEDNIGRNHTAKVYSDTENKTKTKECILDDYVDDFLFTADKSIREYILRNKINGMEEFNKLSKMSKAERNDLIKKNKMIDRFDL